MSSSPYDKSVFVNCPFDPSYSKFFNAMIFTIYGCGYRPRCAWELADSGRIRILEIRKLIAKCRFGVHDISYAKQDPNTKLARFNMPLELGLFLGAQYYGNKKQMKKICQIFDKNKYSYRKSISDLAGHEIAAHGNSIKKIISIIRNWLQNHTHKKLPLVESIIADYRAFLCYAPRLHSRIFNKYKLHQTKLMKIPDMPYIDFVTVIEKWLKDRSSYK